MARYIVPCGMMYLAIIFHIACKVQHKPLEVHVLLQENLSLKPRSKRFTILTLDLKKLPLTMQYRTAFSRCAKIGCNCSGFAIETLCLSELLLNTFYITQTP